MKPYLDDTEIAREVIKRAHALSYDMNGGVNELIPQETRSNLHEIPPVDRLLLVCNYVFRKSGWGRYLDPGLQNIRTCENAINSNEDIARCIRECTSSDDWSPLFHVLQVKFPYPVCAARYGISARQGSESRSNAWQIPHISGLWSSRRDTVNQLYDLLLKKKLVHVRGPSGCGKTTLMNLLHDYILEHLPTAIVITQHSWPPKGSDLSDSLEGKLRKVDPTFPEPSSLIFLLFDEGQDTYNDRTLWVSFLEEVSHGNHWRYRAILFCKQGTPIPLPGNRTMQVTQILSRGACISLQPQEGCGTGLLLTRPEFDEAVSRFDPSLHLRPRLLDLIYDWTAGHVGAVIEMLHVISNEESLDNRRTGPFTLEDFYREYPTHVLVQKLCGGTFKSGLPDTEELSTQPDVVALFKDLLGNGAVNGEIENDAIPKCDRNGWIHADMPADLIHVRYMFASPLHAMCLSWRLEATYDDISDFACLPDLVFAAVSNLKPSQIHFPICRNGQSTRTVCQEAQYQDEFYRSVFSITSCNVRLSPEFASGSKVRVAGRIDFLIPVVNWGIEITRDGERLSEHRAMFADFDAYHVLLKANDMTHYTLLDFRTTIPTEQSPELKNLFHIVFQNDYKEAFVYDNMAQPVQGPIFLSGND